MGILKCRIGLVWSLLLTVILTVIPKYWELKIESIPQVTPPANLLAKTEIVEDTIQKNRTLVATLVDRPINAMRRPACCSCASVAVNCSGATNATGVRGA